MSNSACLFSWKGTGHKNAALIVTRMFIACLSLSTVDKTKCTIRENALGTCREFKGQREGIRRVKLLSSCRTIEFCKVSYHRQELIIGSGIFCRTKMPVDCGILSASPPMYGFLSFTTNNFMLPGDLKRYQKNGYENGYYCCDYTDQTSDFTSGIEQLSTVPSKSCLCASSTKNGFTRKNSLKCSKKVRFADDAGYALFTIKLMREPSQCPPKLNEEVLASVRADAFASVKAEEPWKLDFQQPAADYYEFRQKLSAHSVKLENVVVKDYTLAGTIKVKNVAFEKRVGVRITFDCWETFVDIPGSYLNDGGLSRSNFDTFSFTIHIPPETSKENRLEFCVYYKTNGEECWDSNGGKNYVLLPTDAKAPANVPKHLPSHRDVLLSTDNGPEFAIWNCLDNTSPYW